MAEQPTNARSGAGGKFPRTARATLKLEDGRIVIENQDGSGEQIRVGNGGVIHWDCPADSAIRWWAIVMKNETPFEGDDGWAGSNRGRQGVTRIRKDANGGGTRSYAYAVVASDGREVFFRDPEVVVGPTDPPDEPDDDNRP